ncbi:MAG TPA: hypothetical protein DDY49_03315, partial [Paenibacillaceae bacterium]|nr:hypothetical protein [Paenibacillaceae bacterium]
GTSLIAFFRNIGMALGVSILGVIVNNRIADTLSQTMGNMAGQFGGNQDAQVLFSAEAKAMIPPPVFQKLQEGLGNAITDVFVVCIGITVILFLLAFLAGKARLVKKEGPEVRQAEQGKEVSPVIVEAARE